MKKYMPYGLPVLSDLTIDENHIYRLNGIELPSVSSIIHGAKPIYDNGAVSRGKIIHKQIEDENNEYWQKIKEKYELITIVNEYMLTNGEYAGTMDKLVMKNEEIMLLEIKTGKEYAWHKAQAGAYINLLHTWNIMASMTIFYYYDMEKIEYCGNDEALSEWDKKYKKWSSKGSGDPLNSVV